MKENQMVKDQFRLLLRQNKHRFPKLRQTLNSPTEQGVYIIRKDDTVLHVGRTLRGEKGLQQRLKNHLTGASSFTKQYLKGNGAELRKGYNYQFLIIEDNRLRALVEAYAIGMLCPMHIGLGS
jgi:hypothetical protein